MKVTFVSTAGAEAPTLDSTKTGSAGITSHLSEGSSAHHKQPTRLPERQIVYCGEASCVRAPLELSALTAATKRETNEADVNAAEMSADDVTR